MNTFKPTKYILQSLLSGQTFEDTNWILDFHKDKSPSFIRAIYEQKQMNVKDESFGLYKFSDWLPVSRMLDGSSAPITYKSYGLSKYLGLENLYITFSGYWPEKGAFIKTCSFKETEAYSVCGRMSKNSDKVLVVASAGNTARSFGRVCSDNNIPLLLCIPEDNLNALWFDEPLKDCVKIIAAKSGGDYFDAIHLSDVVCGSDVFYPEGGAKNVARRDGMATTVYSAVTTIGKIPDYYFQAVGSGTGAIAAWEANLRFIEDGRFGSNKMKLMISQNEPFLPIYNAWKAKSKKILHLDDDIARKQVEKIISKVLSNRKPPYSINGGIYNALKDTDGKVLKASNQELTEASKLFLKLEGADIHSAAAVATATLIKTVNNGDIDKNSIVMLNITGGGEEIFKKNKKIYFAKANIVFPQHTDNSMIIENTKKLFGL